MTTKKRDGLCSTFERIYFIGAGFSAGLHYPVGRTLMPDLLKYLRGTQEVEDADYKFGSSLYAEENGRYGRQRSFALSSECCRRISG